MITGVPQSAVLPEMVRRPSPPPLPFQLPPTDLSTSSQCAECHGEQSDHELARTTEVSFLCKKCRKAFRKDMTVFEDADEFCPHVRCALFCLRPLQEIADDSGLRWTVRQPFHNRGQDASSRHRGRGRRRQGGRERDSEPGRPRVEPQAAGGRSAAVMGRRSGEQSWVTQARSIAQRSSSFVRMS